MKTHYHLPACPGVVKAGDTMSDKSVSTSEHRYRMQVFSSMTWR